MNADPVLSNVILVIKKFPPRELHHEMCHGSIFTTGNFRKVLITKKRCPLNVFYHQKSGLFSRFKKVLRNRISTCNSYEQ